MLLTQLERYQDYVRSFISALKIDLTRLASETTENPDNTFQSGVLTHYLGDQDGFCFLTYQVEKGTRVLLFEHNGGFRSEFIVLQAFLNQYRNHPEMLPVVNTDELDIGVNVACISVYQQLLEIMLMPLNSYDDFYRAMQKYEAVTGTQVLNTVMYKKPIFTGAIEDWRTPRDDQYEYVKKLSDHEYHIGYSERGGERTDYIMHDVRLVYEYILERYCRVITF